MSDQPNIYDAIQAHAATVEQADPGMPSWTGEEDRNCLSWWFPKLEASGLPVPRTRIVRSEKPLIHFMRDVYTETPLEQAERDEVSLDIFFEELDKGAKEVGGYPVFLRNGHFSGKHDWERTCFVPCEADLRSHVYSIVEMGEMVSFFGFPSDIWAVREMLPVQPLYRCTRYRNMPVVREVRVFVDGERVVYWQPYWPMEALEQGQPDKAFWRATYVDDHHIRGTDIQIVRDLASRAGAALGGRWSIDVLDTVKGWFITDCALAEESYGFDLKRYES